MNLKKHGYLKTGFRRFDTMAAGIGVLGIIAALAAATSSVKLLSLLDVNSLIFIVVGTISVILFQYDLKSISLAVRDLTASLMPWKLRKLRHASKMLDHAVEQGRSFSDLPHKGTVSGEILNDAGFFFASGLTFDEIDELLASDLLNEIQYRRRSVEIFFKASQLAPALGLLGTVIGLVGVLRSLGDPSQIGGAMSLALMTTAYGSVLGSLICGPAAGRIDANAESLALVHRELIRKLHILYLRSETNLAKLRQPGAA
jgi:chemotaxis protein MotA